MELGTIHFSKIMRRLYLSSNTRHNITRLASDDGIYSNRLRNMSKSLSFYLAE